MDRFLCLNSGSEAVCLAARISDVNAMLMTDPGGRHANRQIRTASLCGGFHGRTDRAAQFSDSSRHNYVRYHSPRIARSASEGGRDLRWGGGVAALISIPLRLTDKINVSPSTAWPPATDRTGDFWRVSAPYICRLR